MVSQRLTAGPMTMLLEDGRLRDLRLEGVMVLTEIGAAVRDRKRRLAGTG